MARIPVQHRDRGANGRRLLWRALSSRPAAGAWRRRHDACVDLVVSSHGRTCSRSSTAERAINLGAAPCDVPLKRVFGIDVSVCPLCGGTLRVIADVTDPDVIQTILVHMKQRAPPGAVHRQMPFKGAQNDFFAAS